MVLHCPVAHSILRCVSSAADELTASHIAHDDLVAAIKRGLQWERQQQAQRAGAAGERSGGFFCLCDIALPPVPLAACTPTRMPRLAANSDFRCHPCPPNAEPAPAPLAHLFNVRAADPQAAAKQIVLLEAGWAMWACRPRETPPPCAMAAAFTFGRADNGGRGRAARHPMQGLDVPRGRCACCGAAAGDAPPIEAQAACCRAPGAGGQAQGACLSIQG